MKYRKRILETKVKKYIKIFPVVGITGPRQSGKSTMLKELFKDRYKYVSFDDYRIYDFFYEDPEKFISTYNNKVIFDEVQKVPEIFNYLKLAVDQDRQNYGKFIITGSSQFSFLKKITESLAGRIGLLSLLPFQYSELPKKMKSEAIYKGSYPEIVCRNYKSSNEWYSSYLETYLDKDVRLIYNIGDLRDFRRFISLLASKTSNILNMSKFSNDLGVTVTTIKRWLSILEASYIIFFLSPYYKNFNKRVVKSPKIYFYDTGLVCYLTGIQTKQIYEKGPMAGAIFENYVISEIMKKNIHNKSEHFLYYFRTSTGEEIDLIEENRGVKNWIEIKNTQTFKSLMTKPIEAFIGKKEMGYLLYQGKDFPYKNNVKILNYERYLE